MGVEPCIALCPVNVLDLNNKMIIVDEPRIVLTVNYVFHHVLFLH